MQGKSTAVACIAAVQMRTLAIQTALHVTVRPLTLLSSLHHQDVQHLAAGNERPTFGHSMPLPLCLPLQ